MSQYLIIYIWSTKRFPLVGQICIKLNVNLRKAAKIFYQTLYSENNKQNVSLPLRFVFNETTIAAAKKTKRIFQNFYLLLMCVGQYLIPNNDILPFSFGNAIAKWKPKFYRQITWVQDFTQSPNFTPQTSSALTNTLCLQSMLTNELIEEVMVICDGRSTAKWPYIENSFSQYL